MPMPTPEKSAATRPAAIILSDPSMTFMATALANPILAGNEKSTLPGPREITNICATPVITEKTARAGCPRLKPPRGPRAGGEGNHKKPHQQGAEIRPNPWSGKNVEPKPHDA